VQQLEAAMQQALEAHPLDRPTAWRRVAGPVSALVAAISRLGWSISSHRQLQTDAGEQLDLLLDPPCVVAQAARRAVRRWRVAGLGQALPALIPRAPDLVVDRDRSERPPVDRQELVLDFADVLNNLLTTGGKTGKRAFADWDTKCKGELRSAITGGQWPQARLAAVRSWTDTATCQLCQAATGTLQHRHTCTATVPNEGWPAPSAEAGKLGARLEASRQLLLQTRGLFTLKVSVPMCPYDDTFTWIIPLPLDHEVEDLRWFVDGSLFDEYKRFMRRTGFGVVAVDRFGSLVACGYGIPPRWIHDAAGAELWAVCFVLGLGSHAIPAIVTDCKGILDSLRWAPQTLTSHDKALARTWSMIRVRLDDDLQQLAKQLTWMPCHTAQSSIGVTLDSAGRPITATMWRANRLVDALAKRAAGQYRLPAWAVRRIEQAKQLVTYSAAKLGVVPHRANHFQVQEVTASGAVATRTHRDSTATRVPHRPGHRQSSPAVLESPPAGTMADSQRMPPRPPARGTKRAADPSRQAAAATLKKRRAFCKLQALVAERQAVADAGRWLAEWAAHPRAAASGPSAADKL
jgi:hypothetical protein